MSFQHFNPLTIPHSWSGGCHIILSLGFLRLLSQEGFWFIGVSREGNDQVARHLHWWLVCFLLLLLVATLCLSGGATVALLHTNDKFACIVVNLLILSIEYYLVGYGHL